MWPSPPLWNLNELSVGFHRLLGVKMVMAMSWPDQCPTIYPLLFKHLKLSSLSSVNINVNIEMINLNQVH